MAKIKISSTDAKLKNANSRPEMHGQDTKIAQDLKFEAVVDGALLKMLCGADEIPPFWHEDGTVKYIGLGMIPSRAAMTEAAVEFGDLAHHKIRIQGAKVNSFKFTPIGGRGIKLELRVQYHPTDDELVKWTHAVLKTMELYIESELGGVPVEESQEEPEPSLLDD